MPACTVHRASRPTAETLSTGTDLYGEVPRRHRRVVCAHPHQAGAEAAHGLVLKLNDMKSFTIAKENSGEKITKLAVDGRTIDGYFITQDDRTKGNELTVPTK
jgi:hypothetical protein